MKLRTFKTRLSKVPQSSPPLPPAALKELKSSCS